MNAPRIRAASRDDVAFLVDCVRKTVEAMAASGGHPVTTDLAPWRDTAAQLDAQIDDPACCLRIAEAGHAIGVVTARIDGLDDIFVPIRSLHVSVVYVVPEARGSGVGRRLVEEALAWGRAAGCTRADLHVLARNPARRLYEALGFAPFQIEMSRTL